MNTIKNKQKSKYRLKYNKNSKSSIKSLFNKAKTKIKNHTIYTKLLNSPLLPPSKTNFVDAFTNVYEKNIWGDNNDPNYEGSSGTGSDIKYNSKTYVPFLKHFIKKHKIKNVVDLGSGDFLVGLLIYDKMGVNYTGYDAYKKLVDYNNKKYQGYGMFKFIHSDFREIGEREKIVPAELCILKDVVQHWPTADIIAFLDYLIESKKYKYILLCNCFTGNPENTATHRTDIKPGQFSALSSTTYPLNKYNIEVVYTWDTKEVSVITVKNFNETEINTLNELNDLLEKERMSSNGKLSSKSQSLIHYNKTYFTARIILQNNTGRIEHDMNTLKIILENSGGIVEVVYYDRMMNSSNTSNNYQNQKQYISTRVNIQFFLEHTFVINSKIIFPADKSYIFINQENIQDWDLLNLQDKSVIPLCKSKFNLAQLQNIGISNAKYIGFGNSNEKYSNLHLIYPIPNLCLHIAGSTLLKGTKVLIETWISKRIKAPLIITAYNKHFSNENLFSYWKTYDPSIKELPNDILKLWKSNNNSPIHIPKFENVGSIYFCKDELSEKVIKFLQHIADIHIYPSLIEEWGQIIDEGRQAKALVITLDAPPMNELIDISNGILVKATRGDDLQDILPYNNIKYFAKNISYQTYKSSGQDLYNAIKQAINMSYEERRSLGEIAFHKSQIDYYTFKKHFTSLIQMDIMAIKKAQRGQDREKGKYNLQSGQIAPTQLMQNKCNNNVEILIQKKNINKIDHICNSISINPTYLKKNEKQIIISEYVARDGNDARDSFADIFIREIFNIWLYTESYFPGNHKMTDKNNLIIVLKHYTNNEVNRLRLSFFKQLYKTVYVKSFNTNTDKRFTYKTVILENNSRFLHTENLMKINYWISNRPGQNPYLKSLITIAKKSLGIFNTNMNANTSNKIGFLYRSKYKCVYDNNIYMKEDIKNKMDHVYYLLKDKLKDKLTDKLSDKLSDKLKESVHVTDLSLYYEAYDMDNKNIEDIAKFIKDKKIIISVHCSDLIHLCLLPNDASIIEITTSKHWYCDPVCKDHLSGKKAYDEDCGNRSYVITKGYSPCGGVGVSGVSNPQINEFYNVENSELYYNRAVYHNLALLCCKNWIEFQIDNGKDYKNHENHENSDTNEINELYINTDKLVSVIRDVYEK